MSIVDKLGDEIWICPDDHFVLTKLSKHAIFENAISYTKTTEIKPLMWSCQCQPTLDVSYYDHISAKLGNETILIEWKSWKEYPAYTCQLPWGEFLRGDTLDEIKEMVEQERKRYIELLRTGSWI